MNKILLKISFVVFITYLTVVLLNIFTTFYDYKVKNIRDDVKILKEYVVKFKNTEYKDTSKFLTDYNRIFKLKK